MKKMRFLFLMLVLVLIAGCYNQSTQQSQPSAQVQTNPVQANPSPAAGPANQDAASGAMPSVVTVTIKNFAFSPQTATIKAGDTVKWINEDSASHKILADSFSSDALSNGGSYEHKFDSKGTYSYKCSIHPSMQGSVVVE